MFCKPLCHFTLNVPFPFELKQIHIWETVMSVSACSIPMYSNIARSIRFFNQTATKHMYTHGVVYSCKNAHLIGKRYEQSWTCKSTNYYKVDSVTRHCTAKINMQSTWNPFLHFQMQKTWFCYPTYQEHGYWYVHWKTDKFCWIIWCTG